jgi:hypothetical protein
MKKIIFCILIIFTIGLIVQANEKMTANNSNEISFVQSFNNSNDAGNFKVSEYSKKIKTSTMKNPEAMINLGKTLTFTGIGGFISGGLLTGAAGLLTYFAIRQAGGSDFVANNMNGKNFWLSLVFSNDPVVTGLAATAVFLFAAGGLLMALSFLIIPGIIIWAVGAGARVKSESANASSLKLKPFICTNGIGLSLSL